ncbi:MAG TPA: ABC transporter substrate-binding protein [Flavobacteriaceae bacterium]|nr:ABC transporter substrate-binding protein [Flavobacteriaceae bacterium]
MKFFKNTFLLSCVGYFLFSCGEGSEKSRDHLIFRYNEFANISSLDPAFAKDQRNLWPCNQLYNGLVQLDENLNIQPDIAQSWTIADSGTTYTFFLRKDVFFHKHPIFGKDSTRKVTADDFVLASTAFAIRKSLPRELGCCGMWNPIQRLMIPY